MLYQFNVPIWWPSMLRLSMGWPLAIDEEGRKWAASLARRETGEDEEDEDDIVAGATVTVALSLFQRITLQTVEHDLNMASIIYEALHQQKQKDLPLHASLPQLLVALGYVRSWSRA